MRPSTLAVPRSPHYLYKILKTSVVPLSALIARAHSIAVPLRPLSVIKLASPRSPAPGGAGGAPRVGGLGYSERSVPATVDSAVSRASARQLERYSKRQHPQFLINSSVLSCPEFCVLTDHRVLFCLHPNTGRVLVTS